MCRVCCGPAPGDDRVCFACRWVARRLGTSLAPVFVTRLCPLPSTLYAVLLGYKEAPVAEARRRYAAVVRDLFDVFLAAHTDCIGAAAYGLPQLALPVPSAARPASPLAAVPGLAETVCARITGVRWDPGVLVRSSAAIGHMRPDAGAFVVTAPARRVVGCNVVLLEDTYVSGARAQSAAAALRRGGARSVVIVALGRVLRPDRSLLHADFLRRHRLDTAAKDGAGCVAGAPPCCRCLQTPASTE